MDLSKVTLGEIWSEIKKLERQKIRGRSVWFIEFSTTPPGEGFDHSSIFQAHLRGLDLATPEQVMIHALKSDLPLDAEATITEWPPQNLVWEFDDEIRDRSQRKLESDDPKNT